MTGKRHGSSQSYTHLETIQFTQFGETLEKVKIIRKLDSLIFTICFNSILKITYIFQYL